MARTSTRPCKNTDDSTQSSTFSETIETNVLAEAQKKFQTEVKRHIAVLESSRGITKGEAVQILLERVAGKFPPPSPVQISEMVTKYGVVEEDATRALVVRDELQRLRKAGLDTLAALREITSRMQKKALSEGTIFSINLSKCEDQETKKRDRPSSSLQNAHGMPQDLEVLVEDSSASLVVKRLKMFATVSQINNNPSIGGLSERKENQTFKAEKKNEKSSSTTIAANASSSSSTRVVKRVNSIENEAVKWSRRKK